MKRVRGATFQKQAMLGREDFAKIGNGFDDAASRYNDTLICIYPDLLTRTVRALQEALIRIRASNDRCKFSRNQSLATIDQITFRNTRKKMIDVLCWPLKWDAPHIGK